MLSWIDRFRHRIVGRMILYVIVPTAILFALIVAVVNRRNFARLEQIGKQRLEALAVQVAARLEDQNNNAVLSAQRMAEAQMAGMFGDRRASLDYARTVLENTPGITGAYFGYEPDADQQDVQGLEALPEKAMDPSGRFIPYWYVVPGRGRVIELEPLVDMETSLYYDGARKAFEESKKPTPMVTEPYVYQGKMIVEQTYPIVVDGKFVGVAGVDRALVDVEHDLRQFATKGDIDLFLISSRGKFIAATTDPADSGAGDAGAATATALKTRAVADTDYRAIFSDLLAATGQIQTIVAEDPSDGETYYFVAAQIPTGRWTLVVRESRQILVHAIWEILRMGIAAALLALTIFTTILLAMAARLSRRIHQAVEAASRVAEGDLTQEIDTGGCRDETGSLLRALRTMMENLNSLVGKVRQSSIQLNSTATELSATGHQQETTASTFGSSANEIAAAVKQISATGSELVQTMDEVSRVASGTANLATEGREGLQAMETNMHGLDEATASIGEKLATINEKATNITGVVTTITKVADQTNLLSVNAAIEAEKAGEYGVGFLVVAREIRRLADQTASATLDIEQMVAQMQSAVSAGVMEMDRFTDVVRRSVTDVAEISQQMGQIIERVNANSASFERVSESMQSQSQGADQISDAMQHLTGDAKQTVEALGEYAQAADDLQQAITFLKSSIASFRLKK